MTAKLTIENDLTTRMTERQPVTSVLQDSGQKSSIETFVLYLKFWLRFKVSNIDPLPRKAVSRSQQLSNQMEVTRKDVKKLTELRKENIFL